MLFLLTAGTVSLYLLMPQEFLPEEDQGYIMAGVKLPAGTSLNHTRDAMLRLSEKLQAHELVKAVISIGGADLLADNTRPDAGILFVALKDWSERLEDEQGVDDLLEWLEESAPEIAPEAAVMGANPPAIPELGMTDNASCWT